LGKSGAKVQGFFESCNFFGIFLCLSDEFDIFIEIIGRKFVFFNKVAYLCRDND